MRASSWGDIISPCRRGCGAPSGCFAAWSDGIRRSSATRNSCLPPPSQREGMCHEVRIPRWAGPRIGQHAGLVASRRLAGVEVAGRNAAELVARGDVELQEDLAQVVLHRAGADEQLRADLGIGETLSRQPRDVRLLGCEHLARVVGALSHRLTRGQELVPRALGESLGPDAAERLVSRSELLTRVDAAILAPQPLAVQEPGAGEVDHAAA